MFDLNSQLLIKNTPKNHREIRGLLGKLRESKAMQINVETRFLLVAQSATSSCTLNEWEVETLYVAAVGGTLTIELALLRLEFVDTPERSVQV